jgi:glycogen operon protein
VVVGLDWDHPDEALLEFTCRLIAIRRAHPAFRQSGWFEGRARARAGVPDIVWFRPDGAEMTAADWHLPWSKAIGVFLNGTELPDRDRPGTAVTDESFLLCLNPHGEPVRFTLPGPPFGSAWDCVVDTSAPGSDPGGTRVEANAAVSLEPASLRMVRRVAAPS